EAAADGAGADALQQRRHRRGVAQPRAVIDVVGPQGRADELLEEVGLLVGALGRAEARQGARAVRLLDRLEPAGDQVERLVPGRLAEGRHHLVVAHDAVPAVAADLAGERPLGVELGPADQRPGEALAVLGVVPAVAALDAQAALVAGAVAALGPEDVAVVDVVGQGAADAAVGADAVHGGRLGARPQRQGERLVGQRPGGAGGGALAAGDAGALAHRGVEVEGDLRGRGAAGPADDVVGLDLVAGPDAAVAEDARLVVHGDHRRAVIPGPPCPGNLPGCRQPVAPRQGLQLAVAGGALAGAGGGVLGQQQLGQDAAALLDARAGGLDDHALLAQA